MIHRSASEKSKKIILTIILLFTFFLFIYSIIYKSIPIRYDDENHWIGRGYFFELLLKRDFKNSLWESFYAYDQPKIANYYYALLFYPDFLKENHKKDYDYEKYLIDHNFYRIDSRDYENYKENNQNYIHWNYDNSYGYWDNTKLKKQFGSAFQKTILMVYKARFMNVILLCFGVLLVFFITLKISNTIISLFTSILFGFNSLIVLFSIVAQSDGLFNFLFLLTIYFHIMLLQKLFQNKNYFPSLLGLSITLPLVSATKINGSILLFFTFSTLVLSAIYAKFKQKKLLSGFIISGLIIFVMFTCIFTVVDPFLYPNPLLKSMSLFSHRQLESERQVNNHKEQSLPNIGSRFKAIYSNFIFDQKNSCIYNHDFFSSNYCKKNPLIFYILKIFTIIAGLFFIINSILKEKNFFLMYILGLFIFIQIMMGIYLIIDRSRYYMQLVYFFSFFQGYGLYYLGNKIHKYLMTYRWSL